METLYNLWLRVFIDGVPLPDSISKSLHNYLESGFVKFTTEKETDHVELKFKLPSRFRGWLDTISDDTPLTVEIGYTHNYITVSGVIKKLEASFTAENSITVTLGTVGADFLMAIATRISNTEFTEMDLDDAVRLVAKAWQLDLVLEPTGVHWDTGMIYIKPSYQSDLAFLEGMAKRIGYLCYVTAGVLHFHPPTYVSPEPVVELVYGDNLISASPEFKLKQATYTTVTGNIEDSSKETTEGETTAEDTPAVGVGESPASLKYGVNKKTGEFEVVGDGF